MKKQNRFISGCLFASIVALFAAASFANEFEEFPVGKIFPEYGIEAMSGGSYYVSNAVINTTNPATFGAISAGAVTATSIANSGGTTQSNLRVLGNTSLNTVTATGAITAASATFTGTLGATTNGYFTIVQDAGNTNKLAYISGAITNILDANINQ